MGAWRESRERAFLDDPNIYPEFSLLIKRQSLQHALRLGFHQNRTAALVALAAVSVALSGALAPPSSAAGFWYAAASSGASSSPLHEWGEFLIRGLALDLLARHFKGFASAAACMLVMTAVTSLVYPLHRLIVVLPEPRLPPPPPSSPPPSPSSSSPPPPLPLPPPPPRPLLRTPLLSALAVLSTAVAPVWTLAVWGAGNLEWGLASGLSVGLLAASLSLKSASFAQWWWRRYCSFCCSCSSTSSYPSPPPSKSNPNFSSSGSCKPPTPSALNSSSCCSLPPCYLCCRAATEGTTTEKAPHREGGNGELRGRERRGLRRLLPIRLAYGEFLVFLLAAPTLVCDPRLLRAGARRRRRLARAASEFAHALLAFVALHAACSALFAPTLRVVAAYLLSSPSTSAWASTSPCSFEHGLSPASCDAAADGGGGGCAISWVDCARWAGADGTLGCSSRWLFALPLLGGGGGPLGENEQCAAPSFESLFCARPTGFDIAAWRRRRAAASFAAAAWSIFVLSPLVHFLTFYAFWHCVCLGLAELTGYPDRFLYGPWWLLAEEPDTMFRLWSTPVHRWLSTCVYRPVVAFFANHGEMQRRWRHRLLGSTAAFVVSSVVHEAVTFVAMRRTCWPFNSFCLVLSVAVIAAWDTAYPVRSIISEGDGDNSGGGGGGSGVRDERDDGAFKPDVSTPDPARTSAEPTAGSTAAAMTADSNTTLGAAGYFSERDKPSLPAAAAATAAAVGMPGATAANGVTPPGERQDRPTYVFVGEDVSRRKGAPGGGGGGSVEIGVGSGDSGDSGGPPPKVKKPGSVWRGWGAVAFFQGTSLVMGLVVDFLAWEWWRQTLLL